jgi:hypothetical protein
MIRVPVYVLLVFTGATVSGTALAQDVTIKDAIQCNDFKHNSDGSWYAESASLNYGPGKKQQTNFFNARIKKGPAKAGEPDMWALLNEKCGTGH